MINVKESTLEQLIEEYNKCQDDWGKYSSNC